MPIFSKFSILGETKLKNSFPWAQFMLSDYEVGTRRDRGKNGDCLIKYVTRCTIF